MKNLHNWALISEDAAMLAAANTEDLPNIIHRLRKYREEGETMEATLPVFAAIIALSVTFPEILKVSFKSQAVKGEWAAFCKMQGWCDLSGRMQKAIQAVSIETGRLHKVDLNSRMDPPARQTWLPWTGRAENVLHELTQAYVSHAYREDEKPGMWLRQNEKDVELTYWLEANLSFGDAVYVSEGKIHLRPQIRQDKTRGTFIHNNVTHNTASFLGNINVILRRHTEDVRNAVEKKAQLAEGYGMGAEAIKQFAKMPWQMPTDSRDDILDALAASNLNVRETKTPQKLMNENMSNMLNEIGKFNHKDNTMNLTQKASAFFGNLKSVGLDLLRVQRGRATLHSAKRVIFAALPIKWGFLARLTGKAKKVENHPLTDLGLALALHGATNFAISDVAKREKYLKYTEEMLVAAGYNVSMKMLPIEDMLDKVFAGVNESEAMTKLKELVKDTGEQVSDQQ